MYSYIFKLHKIFLPAGGLVVASGAGSGAGFASALLSQGVSTISLFVGVNLEQELKLFGSTISSHVQYTSP